MSTEKEPTLILQVDLQCEKCYNKIQKLLCKLQPKENIRKIDYGKKENTVTISGPFDPQKLSKKLKCKACDVIKDIKIGKPPVPPPPLPPPPPPPLPPPPPPPPPSSTTTVNLQLNNMCVMCYPWPCSDPTHCWGVQPQPVPATRQGGRHQHLLPWGKCSPCGGPPDCGGCGSCRRQPPCGGPSDCGGCGSCPRQPKCCPGPSACRGCNGCRIVRESKFSYEEYPPSACAIM